ncbi:hypothetical protein Hanom_Chr01g00078261 [Helianthus anomalus]
MAEEESHQEEGPLPVLKWDLGLFEQITRGFQFPPEWDARYPSQNQTTADAPSRYITLLKTSSYKATSSCRRWSSCPIFLIIMVSIFHR